jgi:tetratricopeptide (TPR) repeat protein
MDAIFVTELIKTGENIRVDFKRQLDLDTSDNKAELIKDIISLANSSPKGGYLIIGVDDNRNIIGCEVFNEEQIQQIVYTYINPQVEITWTKVEIDGPNPLPICVIEVHGSSRPYKVARAIGKLNQDDVFVRRGSVVTKASPEEIIEMHNQDNKLRNVHQFITAASNHLRVKNFDSAIKAYSKAIEEDPSYDLFIARGEAYINAISHIENSLPAPSHWQSPNNEMKQYFDRERMLCTGAINDFASAVQLADSFEAEKNARLKLFRFGCCKNGINYYTWEQKEDDYKWLRENITGRVLGEIIYLFVSTWEFDDKAWKVGEETVELMNEAIRAGYEESMVYSLRAKGNMVAGNFGLAVNDIDQALAGLDKKEIELIVGLLCDRAEALCAMDRFNDAYETLVEARKIDRESVRQHLLIAYGLNERILIEYALSYEFYEHKLEKPMDSIVKIITLVRGRSSYPNLKHLEQEYPWINRYLKEILGSDLWYQMLNYPDLSFTVEIPMNIT